MHCCWSLLTLVAVFDGDLLADVLYLQQQLDTLDGRHGGLGDGRGNTSSDEVLSEGDGVRESG